MVVGPAGSTAKEAYDLREHDRDVLEFLSQDPSSTVAFQGLRRRLGIHPEQLSRALHRLADDELVERTDLGYRVTPKALGILTAPPAHPHRPRFHVLRSHLPADTDLRRVVGSLRGTWVGRLRWYGLSEDEDDLRLSWATEDDAIRLDARLRAGQVLIDADVAVPEMRDEAVRLGYLLFQSIAREVSRDLYTGLSG